MQCIKCKAELINSAIYCHKCGKKQSITKRKRRKGFSGGGSVTKRQGNVKRPWVARGPQTKINGKYIRPYVGTFETEGDAWEAIQAHPVTVRTDKFNYTVEDVYNTWKVSHFPSLKSDKGREGYEGAWKHIPPNMRKRKMREVRTHDFQGPIDTLVAAGRSKSLCEKVQQLESQLCQWAIDNDLLTQNYARKIKMPNIESKKTKREFTEKEIAIIYSYCNDLEYWEIARITICWIYTGTRTNELLLINSNEVFLDKSYMIGGLKTEAGKNRIIPIHSVIRPFIEIWYDMGSDYLIPNANGTKHDADHLRKRFNKFIEYLSTVEHLNLEDVEPRTGRRSCASELSRAGVRPEIISRLLGHVDYDTTEIYIMHNLQDLIIGNSLIPAPLVTD